MLEDTLEEIREVIEFAFISVGCRDLNFIVGGDFNVDLYSNSTGAILVKQFMTEWSLIDCHSIIPRNISYTYCHDTLQHYSVIDYFLISQKNKRHVEGISNCGRSY